MMYISPGYIVIMVVSLVLGLITQGWIKAAYRTWSKVPLATGLSGAEVARRMLDQHGLAQVSIARTGGSLTDNYDPRSRVLNLSEGVYNGRSVAAAGVAAHEAGHAVQHAEAYFPGVVRQTLVPAANIGSQMAWVLVMAGLFFQAFSGLILVGAYVFFFAVLFQIVTLPVEFDASRRANLVLAGSLPPEQAAGARAVLRAAAMTYVAAALVAVMNFLYLLGLSRRS